MGKGAGDALGTIGTVAGVASPLLGAGFGIANMIAGAKEQNDAKTALENYKRQQLTNIAEGLQVSTLGSDLQREEQARIASGQIEGLQGAGTRGLLGGLGRVNQANQQVMAQTGAGLDQQQKQIDQMYADDQARIRNMQESREIGDINALSSQYQSGKNDKNMGMGNIIQGVGMLGGAFGNKIGENISTAQATPGQPMNLVDTTAQSPIANQYSSGVNTYGNFFSRNPMNQGANNAYGVFNQYPYTPYGPQNQ